MSGKPLTQYSTNLFDLCVWASRYGSKDPLSLAFEDCPNALHLVVDLTALSGGKFIQRLDRDINFSTGTA